MEILKSYSDGGFNFPEQYRCDDSGSNVGHVVASEFDNHYPEGTSIKLLVHPALDCFTSYDSQNKGQIDGYGPPIPFTCDSEYCLGGC